MGNGLGPGGSLVYLFPLKIYKKLNTTITATNRYTGSNNSWINSISLPVVLQPCKNKHKNISKKVR
jgi:hypothetical protein